MTVTEPANVEPIRADIAQQIDELEPAGLTGLSVLSTARRNPNLSIRGKTDVPFRSCGHPQGWPHPCSPNYDPDAEKCDGASVEWFEFDKFTFYESQTADCLDPKLSPAAVAADALQQGTAWALGTELQSAPWSGNPSLQSAAVDLTPAGGAMSPGEGLAVLLQTLGNIAQGGGQIIAPYVTLAALDNILRYTNGIIRGPGGSRIVTGPGLTGVGPDATGNLGGPYTGEAYLYATTGSLQYNVDQPQPLFDEGDYRAQRLNNSFAEVLRHGKIVFNPSCVYAVRVCLREESCCAGPPPPAPVLAPTAPPEPEPEPVFEDPADTVELADETPPPPPDPEPDRGLDEIEDPFDTYPVGGTIPDVLAWVGGDPDRAAAALEGETRSTLLTQLDAIMQGDD